MPQLIKLFACAKYSYTMNALCMFNMHVFKSPPKDVLSEIFKNGSRIVRSSSRALKYLIQFFFLSYKIRNWSQKEQIFCQDHKAN